jgi:phosphohistidine phosphatase SixA
MQVARLRWPLVSLVFAFVAADAAAAAECINPPKSVIVLRHACKADSGPSDSRVPLCSRGWAQAGELLSRVRPYDVDVVYVTKKMRSAQTAEPLVESRPGIRLEPAIEPTGPAAKALMEDICSKSDSAGRSILYIGHSETVGDALLALGVTAESFEYADGWVVKFKGGKPKKERLPQSEIKCGLGCA